MKIKYTDKELRSMIRVIADLYNDRTVSYERYRHAFELIDKAEYMSFKRLCELVCIGVDKIEGIDAKEYLLMNFNKEDKMTKIVRSL